MFRIIVLICMFFLLYHQSLQADEFPVKNTKDSGEYSLRWAIDKTNEKHNSEPDKIVFEIPLADGSDFSGDGNQDVWVIQLKSRLPFIKDKNNRGTHIIGLTQNRMLESKNINTPVIILRGYDKPFAHTLYLKSDNNIISGLNIQKSKGCGIIIEKCSKNLVQHNWIGLSWDGEKAAGNRNKGISIDNGANNTIVDNVISAVYQPTEDGVGINGKNAINNTIARNKIGTDYKGEKPLGNAASGIEIGLGASHNRIEDNIISGNKHQGIGIGYSGQGGHYNVIINNYIGTNLSGDVLGNGDAGIFLAAGSSNNKIEENWIANNGYREGAQSKDGVNIQEDSVTDPARSINNSILANRIYNNFLLGINLFPNSGADKVTPNDGELKDGDEGPNRLQNYPVLKSAVNCGCNTMVIGSLWTKPNQQYRIDLFSNQSLDETGYGEGENYLGYTKVTTNSWGWGMIYVSLQVNVQVDHFITTTATQLDSDGNPTNTSEFSKGVHVK